ncbi:MAG: cell division topological specificity factor MinE [Christensenellaceae bacterium]|nr:cell division topological specificity factor MinE [Christensenellaceae bacterium]
MKNAGKTKNRLKQLLVCDKKGVSPRLLGIIKNDVEGVLCNYAFLKQNETHVNFNIAENGEYNICITAKAGRVKDFGIYH